MSNFIQNLTQRVTTAWRARFKIAEIEKDILEGAKDQVKTFKLKAI